MRAAVPFTHQPRARSDPLGALWGYRGVGPPRLHERGEFAAGRFAEPTITKLLDTVGDRANEQVSAEPWWLAAIEAPPLFAQFVRTESRKSLEPPPNRELPRLLLCLAPDQPYACCDPPKQRCCSDP